MADLPSSFSKVNDVELRFESLGSEAQFSKLGSNDNYLKDTLDTEITNRTNGDNTLQTNIDNLTSELSTKLTTVPRLIYTGTIDYIAFQTSPPASAGEEGYDLGRVNRVAAVWAEYRAGTSQTLIALQIFKNVGFGDDRLIIDEYVEIPVGQTWDNFHWVHNKDAKVIQYFFYKQYTWTTPP